MQACHIYPPFDFFLEPAKTELFPMAAPFLRLQLIFDTPIKLVMLKLTMGAVDHPQVSCLKCWF